MAYGETAKAKELYHLYIGQLVAAEIKDEEIRAIALDFYNLPAAKALAVEGIPPQYQLPADSSVFPPAEIEKRMNLELAEAVYDVYIKRAMRYPKEQFLAALSEIACSFAATSKGMSDPAYAESVFKKIEDRLGQNALSEELTYLRALNLERAGEFEKAVSCYRDLLKYYPLTARANEVNFKLGMIYGYLLRDIKSAENYFSGLASAEAQDVYQMQALYQLGLLSQWQEDTAAAGAYYDRLIAQAKEDYPEIVELALKRKKEMEENSSLEYNLKLFLDTSFKDEYAAVPLKNSLLSAEPFIAAPAEKIKVSSLVSRPDTGCLQLDLQYLWSGNTGTARPMSGENSFETSYASAGTKEINLLVVSASGILSRNIEFIDIR
jgi:tetratricopeptide (TPR) repeat protein